jgi:hypothetical protein
MPVKKLAWLGRVQLPGAYARHVREAPASTSSASMGVVFRS